MRVAIQNPFSGQRVAETELSKRIYRAATHLGWQAAEVHTSIEINDFKPDFVIALHNNSPKFAGYPTYGCMWNPPSFFQGTEKYVKHVFSYDGYLISSLVVERWLHHLLHHTPKHYFTAPFYTSCPQNSYQAPSLKPPRLVYLGSNWDTPRFQALFEQLELEQLDDQPYINVYGNPEGWTHLQSSYKGSLPYDGSSVFKTLNQAGVGLCLHRAEHTEAELPSMRIFEIVASGAIALCGEHPFIRKAFGDSVLYLDLGVSIEAQVQQISEHMRWIKANPQAAIAMSTRAHQIFLEHYALEKLLLDIVPYHQQLIQSKGFIQPVENQATASIEVVLPITLQSKASAQQILENLTQQTYRNISVIVLTQSVLEIEELLRPFQERLSIRVMEFLPEECKSSILWKGLNAVKSEYFSVLTDVSNLHPNHIFSLVSLLERNLEYGVAYSGTLVTTSISNTSVSDISTLNTSVIQEPLELGFFHPFDLEKLLMFEPFMASNSFIARRSLLNSILHSDPLLKEYAELCLLLYLAQQTRFLFSYETTCEITHPLRSSHQSIFQQSRDWSTEACRLRFIFWYQEFAPGKSLQTVHQSHLAQQRLHTKIEQAHTELRRSHDQLQEAQAIITAMKTSKFWQLRAAWFKVKRMLRLPTEDG